MNLITPPRIYGGLADSLSSDTETDTSKKPDFEPTQFDIMIGTVQKQVKAMVRASGKAYGYDSYTMDNLFYSYWTQDGAIKTAIDARRKLAAYDSLSAADEYLATPKGFSYMVDEVFNWYNTKAPFDLQAGFDFINSQSSGGGGGTRKPTAAEIRDQFDIGALATAATKLWNRDLLEDPEDPRALAHAYVEAVVATGGDKQIDFEQFIRDQASKTSRWASIYRNKPEGIAPEAYIGRYFNAASQALRPQEAASVAIGGAQLGASPESFAARMRRSDSYTDSAPFVNELGSRLEAIKGVLKG